MTMADRHDVNNTSRDVNRDDVAEASQSLRLSPQRQPRPDSGYNTASPATTTSPAPIYTPGRQGGHFMFDDVTTPSARLSVSPEYPRTSASSDSHVTQFHMETDEEEVATAVAPAPARGNANFVGFQLPNLSNESDENADESNDDEEDVFYSRGNILRCWGVASQPQSPRHRSGSLSLRTRRYCMLDEDPEPEKATPISGRQESSRIPRHEMVGGRAVRSHSFSAFRDHMVHEFESSRELWRQEDLSTSQSSFGARGTPPRNALGSPLVCDTSNQRSQSVRVPSASAHGRGEASALEDSVFSFDTEDIDAYRRGRPLANSSRSLEARERHIFSPSLNSPGNATIRQHRSLPSSATDSGRMRHRSVCAAAPVLADRPPQSPSPAAAALTRRRRLGVVSLTSHVRLSCGQLLPCVAVSPGEPERTVSTQTPHATCTIIQQLMTTPAPLPSLARGTAADRLRHYSDGSPAWPGSPPPLPDIIPASSVPMGRRDRSASAPDLRVRTAGREAGRELRRLSDEFFHALQQRRRLSPVGEDLEGHPASFPRMRTTYFRHIADNVRAFFSQSFGSSKASSEDHSSDDL